jgi:hypothetical protein
MLRRAARLDGDSMTTVLIIAGLSQLGLALGSLAIPRILQWNEDTLRLRPLTRQVFWTYAGYIWVTNVCFGLLSCLAPELLLEGTALARIVAGYITAYWGGRLLIQLFYFDRSDAPKGTFFAAAEVALVILFLSLSTAYGFIALGLA